MGVLYQGFCYTDSNKLIDAVYSYESFHFSTSNRINSASISIDYSTLEYLTIASVTYSSATISLTLLPRQCDLLTNGSYYCLTLPSYTIPINLKTCSYDDQEIQPLNITIPSNSINVTASVPSNAFNVTTTVPPNSINQTLNTPASLDSPTPIDTVTASWMVVAVFASAFALKVIRRSL